MKVSGKLQLFLADEKRVALAKHFPSIHFKYDSLDNKVKPLMKKFFGDSDVQTLISECKIMFSQIKSLGGEVEGAFMIKSPEDNIYAIIVFGDSLRITGWDNEKTLDQES